MLFKFPDSLLGITYMQGNLLCKSCLFMGLQDKVFELVIKLKRIQVPSLFEPSGKADGRIACKCTNLQNVLWLDHCADHLNQFSLYRAAQHSGMVCPQVCLFLQPLENRVLLLREIKKIFVQVHVSSGVNCK